MMPAMVFYPPCIYLLKVNNRNPRAVSKIYSDLIVKTSEQLQWRRYGVFIVNFAQISHIVFVFPLLILNK